MEEQAAAVAVTETTEPVEEQAAGGAPTEPGVLGAMAWRGIGPFRGGRGVAVAGDPHDPATFYFGACAGGRPDADLVRRWPDSRIATPAGFGVRESAGPVSAVTVLASPSAILAAE